MSGIEVPAFGRKLSWAERRLCELEIAIAEFRARHPYRTRQAVDRKGRPWIMEFTENPDPDWSLRVGEVLYNLRASLDYLAGALNPASVRSHVMFPIVTEPVWEISVPPDGSGPVADMHRKWETSTGRMDPQAVEIIKRVQPTQDAEGNFHRLELLNRLSNKDRHRQLLVHLSGLADLTVRYVLKDGRVVTDHSEPDVPHGRPGTSALSNYATIHMPFGLSPDSMSDVRIEGTTTQAIRLGDDGRHAVIPDSLRLILEFMEPDPLSRTPILRR